MEGLVGLYEAFSKEGTFLDIEKECHYIKFLMNFWEKEIKEHPTLFFDMVERELIFLISRMYLKLLLIEKYTIILLTI